MPLEPDDQRRLSAARGYLELGMLQEANAELEEIDAFCRSVPEVLAVRLQIYQSMAKWELMEVVAKRLSQHDPENPQWPISVAYATPRAVSIGAARVILLDALTRHPEEPIVHYNLACYGCQLGELQAARDHLKRAFALDPSCRLTAIEDKDLEPLWDSLTSD